MFVRRKPEDLKALLQQRGEEFVREIYRGVLERDPEAEGLAHWAGFLRGGGSLEELIRLTLKSQEFLSSVPARMDAAADPNQHLPPLPRSIGIVSNCQGEVLSRSIQAFTGCRAPKHHCLGWADMESSARLVQVVQTMAQQHEIVLIQPALAQKVMPLVPELAARIEQFPNLSFAAFHPDLCFVYGRRRSDELAGPLGPYHSSIAYHAWRVGMSAKQALDHFRDDVFEALHFYEYWDASARRLHEEGQAAGLPMEGLLEGWRTRGCFMHSLNHPKLEPLVDIARALLLRMGFEPLPMEPTDYLHDLFGSSAAWPLYPEIAARLGIAGGSYQFKTINLGVMPQAPIRMLDLQAFVEQSFTAFERADRDQLRCDRPFSARYREVFGLPATRHQLSAPPLTTVSTSPRLHPYSKLPASQFWRSAISARATHEVDPVIAPRFQLNPATAVATAGSCFAQPISHRLRRRGFHHLIAEAPPADLSAAEAKRRNYGVYSARYGNLYTARQLLQLLDSACGEWQSAEPAWRRPDGRYADPFRPAIEPDGFADEAELMLAREQHLAGVRRMFETVEVFVFTLGLTECWRSRLDGAVFPLAPGVVAGDMSDGRYEFINFDAGQVTADLDAFVRRLSTINPSARILFTVSPVPLAATYEPRHVLAANTYSKSVLRIAAEQIVHRHAHCDYFPSYEIITGHFNSGAYYGQDRRSVNPAGVDHVMRLFFTHYAPAGIVASIDSELLDEADGTFRILCEEERLAG